MKKIVIVLIVVAAAALLYFKPWHKSNLALYAAVNSDVMALTCNTAKEAAKAKEFGVTRFVVDINYTDGVLVTKDGSFRDYFEAAGRDMELIWLNITNLSAENSAEVYNIINSMDIMQEHTLIESPSAAGMAVFEQNGWHTIYTIEEGVELAALEGELAKYNISGVCYPAEADELVRSWLDNINYYSYASFPDSLIVYPHFLGIRVTLAK